MKLKAYDQNENPVDVEALYFDGYSIGERQLEGLVIKVEMSKTIPNDLYVSADWPKGLNTGYWTAEAKKFALQNDVFSTTPELDNDDGFIEVAN